MMKKMRVKVFLILIIFILILSSASSLSYAATSVVGISGFPASYQPYLQQLKAKYPNWEFIALYTGLNWNTVIQAEMGYKKNLVPNTWEAAMRDPTRPEIIDAGGWVHASEAAVKYYMDPRNFLDQQYIFQFELLSYESSIHAQSGVESILSRNIYA